MPASSRGLGYRRPVGLPGPGPARRAHTASARAGRGPAPAGFRIGRPAAWGWARRMAVRRLAARGGGTLAGGPSQSRRHDGAAHASRGPQAERMTPPRTPLLDRRPPRRGSGENGPLERRGKPGHRAEHGHVTTAPRASRRATAEARAQALGG